MAATKTAKAKAEAEQAELAPVVEGDEGTPSEPPSTDLVPAYPEDVYRAMSAADERQIAQEIQGNAPKAMLYGFSQGGQQVIGLSWKGVHEAIRQVNTRGFGRIHIESGSATFTEVTVEVETGKDDAKGRPVTEERQAITCLVYARDEMHGGGHYGTATQHLQMKLSKKDKDGKAIWRPDPFARTKALSKAQRNAMEPFIPLELVEELKVLYKGRGAIEYIPGIGTDVTAEPAPALTDAKAKKQIAKARKLYEALKKKAGLKAMPPAKFNHYLVAAQHDHERLDDFIGHLEQMIGEAADVDKAA